MMGLSPLTLALLLIPALLNLWAIWHAFYHVFDSPQERLLWMGVGIFIPVLGGLFYFFIGRNRARSRLR